ncbi:MAG: hypothetical protein JWM20_998 [Patescibacteria group bacterium]|nr:hypothetical protein [Patescibacteria group bacterium]
MKKTRLVQLVLITALLASCSKHTDNKEWSYGGNDVYMRSDSTAGYQYTGHHGGGFPWMWYYAFRPYGACYGGGYHHGGYYSSAISERANIGSSPFKSSIVRGGLGSHGISVSS